MCLVTQSCPTLCDPMDCNPPGSSAHGVLQGKNTEVGCHFLFQGIFPTQGLNPGLLHHRQILYHLSHQGSSAPHEDIINGLKIIVLIFRWSPSFFKTEYFMGRNDNLFICVPNSRTRSRIQEISEIEKSV